MILHLLSLIPLLGIQAASPLESPLAIVDVTVISMAASEEAELLPGHVVLVREGRIVGFGPAQEMDLPRDAQVVDGSGKFLIPGLVDAHTHTLNPEDFELHLAAGVTTVWEMSGSPGLLALREEIEAGQRLGPRLFIAGPQLKVDAIPFIDTEVSAGTAADVKRHVAGMAADGYDFVKVWGELSPEVFSAVCESAGEAGIRVVGHVPPSVGLGRSLAEGLAAVAHIEEYWNKFFDERADESRLKAAAELTAAANAVVVTTLDTYENITRALRPGLDGLAERPELRFVDPVRAMSWSEPHNAYRQRFDADDSARFADALAFQLRIARALHEAGVPLLAGSDAGGVELSLLPGFALHRELELLVEAGLSPLEALHTATSVPGHFLSPEDPAGVIAAGRRADLLLLEENPLEDIAATRSVAGVVVSGRWLDRQELDRRLAALAARNERTSAFVGAVMQSGSASTTYRELRAGDSGTPLFQEAPVILLGFFLFQSERQREAMELIEVVTSEIPDGYLAYYVLGMALRLTGDLDGARACFQAVLERVPEHRAAREIVAALER